jgi:hypothetical protein
MHFVSLSFTIIPNCDKMFFSFSKVSINIYLFRAIINISLAYAEHCFKRIDIFPLSSRCFKMSSMTILNRVAESELSYFTPVDVSNVSV